MIQPGFVPSVFADAIEFFIGTPATGRATASSTTLDNVVFTLLPGQSIRSVFTPADVGMPIAIVGGGPIDPLMPNYAIRGAMFHTTIAAYVGPGEVILADAPNTSIYNTGFVTVICYRPALFQQDTFKFNCSIAPGTRNTLGATILSTDAYIRRFDVIVKGQPVYMRSTDPNFPQKFGGSIDSMDVMNQPGTDGIFAWVLNCVNWASIAFHRIVNPVNPAVYSNMAGDEVFKRIVFTNLIDDGVSCNAAAAPEINLGAPIGSYINTLLDQIVQQLSTPTDPWYWDVDEWRTYILRPRTATAAPWDVEDGYDLLSGNQPIQVLNSSSRDQLANFVFGIGTAVLFNALNASLSGQNGQQTFNLPQPIAKQPVITLNGGSPLTVGILGVETGKDWYWNQGSTTLTQDSSGTPLTSTDVLLVKYQFTNPGVAQSPNVASLQERQAIEATSGQYDYSFQISQPIAPVDLLGRSEAYQQQYGTPPQAIRLSTLRPGLVPGQLQEINFPNAGVSGTFLIATTQVTIKEQVIRWDYTAFKGNNVGLGVTAMVQFMNRGQGSLSLTQPVPVVGSGYLNSRPITIDHTQVPSDQARFQMVFRGTYPWLKSAANGGTVQNANGYDIIFSSTPDGANPLPFTLVSYDGTSGAVVFWVLVGTVSSSTDTVIYACFNNGNITTNQSTPVEVWAPMGLLAAQPNENFHGVYYLAEAASPYRDASGYGNDSTGNIGAYPTQVAGIIGKAQSFNGSQGIQLPATALNNGTANTVVTLQAWVKTTQTTDGSILESYGGAGNHGASIGIQGSSGKAFIARDDGGAPTSVLSANPINDGNWHFICGVIGGTVGPNDSRLYVDGVLQGSPGAGLTVGFLSATPIGLGNDLRFGVFPYGVNGLVDEARILQWPLTANRIACQFANQKEASTFYSIGNQAGGQTTDVDANPSGTVTHVTGALTVNLPVLGNDGGDVKIGVAGQLVPAGGSTGQILTKLSGADYDDAWADPGAESDILVNGDSTLNMVQVNGVLIWQGQTDILVNGA